METLNKFNTIDNNRLIKVYGGKQHGFTFNITLKGNIHFGRKR